MISLFAAICFKWNISFLPCWF